MAEILIIEDDVRLRAEIQKFLETKGHGVSVESDGAEGLRSIQQIGYDVVVMDIKLPEMSGIDIFPRHFHGKLVPAGADVIVKLAGVRHGHDTI